MDKRIYLDYNATTPIDDAVKAVLIDELEHYANGSSMHMDGRAVSSAIETAREQVAALINASPKEIVFTSGGSEANNTVFQTMNSAALQRTSHLRAAYGERRGIFISSIEHPCVIESAASLAAAGFAVHQIPVTPDGTVLPETLEKFLQEAVSAMAGSPPDPAGAPLLVSVMMANNEIGTIQDVKRLCAIAHQYGALFHTDAVQAAGKIAVDVQDIGCDYLTLSCHKLYGPKGVGALFVRHGAPLETLIRGGHQEHGQRAGTYNSPSIIAFGKAAQLAKEGLASYEAHTRALRNRLRDGFIKLVPDIRINGDPTAVLPNTLNISFPGAEGEAILLMLDIAGISVSTGSACASGSLEPSHVLMATGVGPELAHGSIRFSLGKYTTPEEIDYVLETVPPVIKRLRGFSTVRSN